MTLQEIKSVINSGKKVCWASDIYEVRKSKFEDDYYIIVCITNNSTIGLTWRDGVTLNGKEEEFYIKV
jgi:hypothetical protein